MNIGSLRLEPVSDGVLRLDPGGIFAEAPLEEWRPRVLLDDDGRLPLALTCLLVEARGRHILVDTGFGVRPDNPAVGRLVQELGSRGVAPADIDTVVVSHPHGDHIGGATTGSGEQARLTFPNARYWLGQADWDHFSQPEKLAQSGPLVDKLLPLARADHLDLADGEQEIAPGVRLLPLPGHTPGHMGVAFTDGNEIAVYVGDLVHHPLQIDHPAWSPIFDALPALARETRQTLLERARRDHLLVLSYHFPWPGIGRIDDRGWQPEA